MLIVMALIYTVDDDELINFYLEEVLGAVGHEVVSFHAGAVMIEALRSRPADLLLTDIQMTTMGGFEVMRRARETAPQLPVIMITASSRLEDAIAALRGGATDYVPKPFDEELLCEIVERALRVGRLETENRRILAELSARDESLRRELAIARTIQRELLPDGAPEMPGLEIGFRFEPAGDVGGDYFHFAPSRDGRRLGVILADISGHGIPAALLFCLFKETAEALLHPDLPTPPGEAMGLLNGRIARSFPSGSFVSTLHAIFEPAAHRLICVKGGQEPLLLVRRGRIVETVDRGGLIVGSFDPEIFGEEIYEESVLEVEPGDTALLYTDGLIEVTDATGRLAGSERLAAWIEEAGDLPPQALVDRLLEKSAAWAGGRAPEDDITVIAARFAPA